MIANYWTCWSYHATGSAWIGMATWLLHCALNTSSALQTCYSSCQCCCSFSSSKLIIFISYTSYLLKVGIQEALVRNLQHKQPREQLNVMCTCMHLCFGEALMAHSKLATTIISCGIWANMDGCTVCHLVFCEFITVLYLLSHTFICLPVQMEHKWVSNDSDKIINLYKSTLLDIAQGLAPSLANPLCLIGLIPRISIVSSGIILTCLACINWSWKGE